MIPALMLIALLHFRQTDTPTPVPTPTAGYPLPLLQPLASLTPIPTATPIDLPTQITPLDGVYSYLATAEGNLSSLPDAITDSNTGLPILPSPADQNTLFGYMKWIFSGAVANDVFGPFGPIVIHSAVLLTMGIFLAGVYFALFVARKLINFVVWIVETLIDLIP